jgi:hypothetical protein
MDFEHPRLALSARVERQRFYALLLRRRDGSEYLTPWCSSRIWLKQDIGLARKWGNTPVAVVVAWRK